ncbi:MAG: RsmF rRNA methyltransferase first C-terminal domain-containing protein, partial [Clostridia bacterium]|nr:RsmF rRNA methyltransferase first C-terminal domain-containing protein [Clostridia bacterium]
MDLPKEFLEKRKQIIPDFDNFINAYKDEPIKSFFINTNKISEDDFLRLNQWNVQRCAEGWRLLEDVKIGKTPEHHAGMIYMQELSAMMPVSFLPLKEDDWVLDLCSAPGGKSIQVANKIPHGLLVSNEIVKSRANILKSNIERMGLSNVCIINNDPKELEECFGGIFDAVVVDAPCSGEGMFRKDEQAILNWSQANVEACAVRQLAVLETANKMLKSNGYLLYSTCTFSPEEDENVVAEFCLKHNYNIIPLNYEGAVKGIDGEQVPTSGCLRFYPHKFAGEGQFVAILQKKEECNSFINKGTHFKPLAKFPTEKKLFEEFCKQNLSKYEDVLDKCIYNNNTIYYLANTQIAQSGVRLINGGVVIGEIVKSRFEPNHNLVSCFGDRFTNKVELTSSEVQEYLRGQTINCAKQGYVVLTYKNVVVGLGKASAGVMKNHYPKG